MVRTAQDAPVFYGKFASQSSHYETDDMACEFWHSCMVGGCLLIFGLSASVFLDDVMMFEQRRFMSGAGIPFSINSVKVDQI